MMVSNDAVDGYRSPQGSGNDLEKALPGHTDIATAQSHSNNDNGLLTTPGDTQADIEKSETAATSSSIFDPSQFPDGGLRAWLAVVGAFCCVFSSFGWVNSIGVFQEYYQNGPLSDYSTSTVSWISSIEVFMMFLGGPFIGWYFDNFGPRYLLTVGTTLHIFGLMMTSLASEYYQFVLAQSICSPLGASMLFFPSVSSILTWFFKRRAFALGIIAGGASLGGVVLPIMTRRLIDRLGFGWAMRIAAFLMLGLLIIANLTLTSRLPPRRTPFVLKAFITPFTELTYTLTTLGLFFTFMGLFLPVNYIIVQARSQGMSAQLATYMVPVLNGASLFGRVLPGYVADKVGRFNVLICFQVFVAIIVLGLWLPGRGNAAVIVFTALYGFGSGAFVSLAPAVIGQISEVKQISTRTGMAFIVIAISTLVGTPVGGALVENWDGEFTGLQIYTGVMFAAGGATIFAARCRLVGFNLAIV